MDWKYVLTRKFRDWKKSQKLYNVLWVIGMYTARRVIYSKDSISLVMTLWSQMYKIEIFNESCDCHVSSSRTLNSCQSYLCIIHKTFRYKYKSDSIIKCKTPAWKDIVYSQNHSTLIIAQLQPLSECQTFEFKRSTRNSMLKIYLSPWFSNWNLYSEEYLFFILQRFLFWA